MIDLEIVKEAYILTGKSDRGTDSQADQETRRQIVRHADGQILRKRESRSSDGLLEPISFFPVAFAHNQFKEIC